MHTSPGRLDVGALLMIYSGAFTLPGEEPLRISHRRVPEKNLTFTLTYQTDRISSLKDPLISGWAYFESTHVRLERNGLVTLEGLYSIAGDSIAVDTPTLVRKGGRGRETLVGHSKKSVMELSLFPPPSPHD